MRTPFLFLLAMLVAHGCSCERAGKGARETLNKGGELAGRAATEVIEGVATGVERTWAVDVALSTGLQELGLVRGTIEVATDSSDRSNRLFVYLSGENAFRDTLRAIATDKDGLEMGRTIFLVDLPANGGGHYEVRFQPRTDLSRKSRVVIDRP